MRRRLCPQARRLEGDVAKRKKRSSTLSNKQMIKNLEALMRSIKKKYSEQFKRKA